MGPCQSHPLHRLYSRAVRLISSCDFPILQDSGDTGSNRLLKADGTAQTKTLSTPQATQGL